MADGRLLVPPTHKIVKAIAIPLKLPYWSSPDGLLTRDIAIGVPADSVACFK